MAKLLESALWWLALNCFVWLDEINSIEPL